MGFICAQRLPNGSKTRAKTMQLEFRSQDECIDFLLEAHDDKRFFGLPANILLNHGGKRNLMWVDVDAPFEMFETWRREGLPFPEGSYQHVRSSTGNAHLYVSTDRPLKPDECFSMCEYIQESAPDFIAPHIDRVHGPRNLEPIFIPNGLDGPTMPQRLMSTTSKTFVLPDIEGSIYSEWLKRNG